MDERKLEVDGIRPMVQGPRSMIVVAAVVALLLLLLAVMLLRDAGVAPDRDEMAWHAALRESAERELPPLDGSTRVVLERTECLGVCPAYRVVLDGAGNVEYLGSHFVCEKGTRHSQVSAKQIRGLVASLDAAQFIEMNRPLVSPVPDAPTVSLSLSRQGKTTTAAFQPIRERSTRLLEAIANEIDAVAGSERWVGAGIGLGYARTCPTEDGRNVPIMQYEYPGGS